MSFIKAKPVSWLAATGVGICTFTTGLYIGVFQNHILNLYEGKYRDLFSSGFSGAAITVVLGGTAVIRYIIGVSVDHEVEQRILANRKLEIEDLNRKFVQGFKPELEKLADELRSADISHESYKLITSKICKLEKSVASFQHISIAADAIVKWLNVRNFENSRQLRNAAVKTVEGHLESQASDVRGKTLVYFKQDIKECVNWIRSSFEYLVPCTMEPSDRYISALSKNLPDGLSCYKIALETVKESMQNSIKEYIQSDIAPSDQVTKSEIIDTASKIIEDMFEELIGRIETLAGKSPSTKNL